jgi:hypothetical protein
MPKAKRQKAGAIAIESAERRAEALAYRKQGYTFAEIGEAMGIAKQSAHALVLGAIAAIAEVPAQEMVALELARLDAMLIGVWQGAISGDPRAIDAVLKIQERRLRLSKQDAADKPGKKEAAFLDAQHAERGTDWDKLLN